MVWSGEQGLPEEPPPPSLLFSFLILFAPSESARLSEAGFTWELASRPLGQIAELLRDGLGDRDLMNCGPYPISLHPAQL